MTKSKFSKYVLYSISEISLVVVGILIAVQIDNWNDDRKKDLLAKELKLAITEDLRADLSAINSVLLKVKQRTIVYDSLQKSLNTSFLSEEEIINIIKKKFDPHITTFSGFKDISYRSAVASGQINSLNSKDKKLLYDLYLNQERSKQSIRMHEERYFNEVNVFVGKYPLKTSFITFNEGPIHHRIWQDVDFIDLLKSFNATGTSQRNYYRIISWDLEKDRVQIARAIQSLKDK